MIFAIDPGTTESAFVRFAPSRNGFTDHGKVPNEHLLDLIKDEWKYSSFLAIEMVASFGMPVGKEVFETCVWIGRFIEAWGVPFAFVYRQEVKLHLCKSAKANDATIRQALIDLYGGKEKAMGNKKSPGPLYGMGCDERSALAVALTYAAKQQEK